MYKFSKKIILFQLAYSKNNEDFFEVVFYVLNNAT
jgi:hypothetical protein